MNSTSNDLIIVALGANLKGSYGSTEALLEAALAWMASAGLKATLRSPWWRSASWPDPTLPDYLNGVVVVETPLDPHRLLDQLRRIETQFGRERGQANAPRTLDLDLIAYGRRILNGADLILPHPRAAERLFVMGPLAQIAPGWVHPTLHLTAARLAEHAKVGADAVPT